MSVFPVVTALGGRRAFVRIGAIAASAAVLLGASACTGPQQTPVAGAAALVGTHRVSDAQLAEQVGELMAAGPLSQAAGDPSVPRLVLRNDILMHLMDVLAAEQGVTATQGDIDTLILAYEQQVQLQGQGSLQQVLATMGVPPSQIESYVRLNVLGNKLSSKLAPEQPIEEGSVVVGAALAEISTRIGTQVSPRYGAWDAASLDIVEAPNRLSTPLKP